MLRFTYGLVCALFLSTIYYAVPVANAQVATENAPFINELKVRFDTNNLLDVNEYIELINPHTVAIDLSGFVLEYFNTTNPIATQEPVQKPISIGILEPGGHLVLAKDPAAIPFSVASPFSSLSDTGGRLRLVTSEGNIVDEVAWTNSSSLATAEGIAPAIIYQCNSSTILCTANRTQSISRQLDTEGNFVVTTPLWLLGTVSPQSTELLPIPVEEEEETPIEDPVPIPTPLTCEGVIITELLPNPEGSDTDREFIELYNPTDAVVSLDTCSLQLSTASSTYTFSGASMQPKTYRVVTDALTGITLPNGSGATVWLLTATDEIQAVTYPGDLEDDSTWSLVGGLWQQSYSPTPGQNNISMPTKPCPANQQRNSETNRCENIIVEAVAALTPCKIGQERNPETNRCRTVVVASSLLVGCKAGQERNPQTSRCRAIGSTVKALTPCAEGQERNTETNRCRKMTGATGSTLAAVTDVKTEPIQASPKWWLAIAAATLAIGYAVFEWRQDILVGLRNAAGRFKR